MKQESVFVPTLLKLPRCLEIGTSRRRHSEWAVIILKSVPERLRQVLGQNPVVPETSQHWFSFVSNSHESAAGPEGLCQILRMAHSER